MDVPSRAGKRIHLYDATGQYSYFEAADAIGCWPIPFTFWGDCNLWRLRNGRWILEGLVGAIPAAVLAEEDALVRLLAADHDPPADLLAAANTLNVGKQPPTLNDATCRPDIVLDTPARPVRAEQPAQSALGGAERRILETLRQALGGALLGRTIARRSALNAATVRKHLRPQGLLRQQGLVTRDGDGYRFAG